jgi:hypothetical protein
MTIGEGGAPQRAHFERDRYRGDAAANRTWIERAAETRRLSAGNPSMMHKSSRSLAWCAHGRIELLGNFGFYECGR